MAGVGASTGGIKSVCFADVANRVQDERALAFLISRIPVLPLTESAAESFGAMRAAVRERNRDTMDRLIAAHALSVGITLVTNNEADFQDYPGLVVENWGQPSSPPLPSKTPSTTPAKKPLKKV